MICGANVKYKYFYNHGPRTLHARFVPLCTDAFVWKLCAAVLSRLFFEAVSCESCNYLQTLSDQQTTFQTLYPIHHWTWTESLEKSLEFFLFNLLLLGSFYKISLAWTSHVDSNKQYLFSWITWVKTNLRHLNMFECLKLVFTHVIQLLTRLLWSEPEAHLLAFAA